MAAIRLSFSILPQVRVGIATGVVVVGELIGEGSSRERVAIGETLNLAARIQTIASPDSVAVPELTHRLGGSAFDYEELGLHELKGIPDTVRVWRVIGESTARGRFQSRVVDGLTPLGAKVEAGDDGKATVTATAQRPKQDCTDSPAICRHLDTIWTRRICR